MCKAHSRVTDTRRVQELLAIAYYIVPINDNFMAKISQKTICENSTCFSIAYKMLKSVLRTHSDYVYKFPWAVSLLVQEMI